MRFQKLIPTGMGRGRHGHVCLLNEGSSDGRCSFDKNHSHELIWNPPQPEQPEQIDEMTGEVIAPAIPAQEGFWMVQPDPYDGHTHEIGEVELKDPKRKKKKDDESVDDKEIVDDVWELWKEAVEVESWSLKKAEEADNFYFGEQWDYSLAQTLKGEGRAVLTKNFTQKYTDDLCGIVREEKKEFRYSPIEGGDKQVADLLSFLTKMILDRTYYQRERAKVFEDSAIVGKGVYNLKVDFTRDIEGEVVIEKFPFRDVLFGPFEKDDASDCEFLVKQKLYSVAKIKQLFPTKAEEIQDDFSSYQLDASHRETGTSGAIDPYAESKNRVPVVWNKFKCIDVAKKEIRVLECWRRVYLTVPVAIEPQLDFVVNCYGWDRKDVESLKTIPGVAVIDRIIPKIRITKVAGNILISDEDPADLPDDDFFVTPVYCKRRDSKYVGKVELAKDSQMEINKRASQAIDIGNRMATYVHYVDDTVFVDEEEERKFLERSNTPGAVFRVNNIERTPKKDEGVKFPTEIVQLMELNKADLRELLNTTTEPRGANTSGTALQAEQRQVLRGNQFLFDNLEFAEIKLGRQLAKVIQRYFSPQKIARMVISAPGKEEVDLDGTPLSQFSEEDIVDLLANKDLTLYDVNVTQNSYSPTTRIATNMMLTELAKSGYGIPPQTLIRFSDLPKNEQDKIMRDIDAQNQAQGQAASETKDMEVTKSLVGQGIIPPSISEQYNLSQAAVVGKAAPMGGIGEGAGFDEEVEIRRDPDGVLRGRKVKIPKTAPSPNMNPSMGV
jgi:hypothetical protein